MGKLILFYLFFFSAFAVSPENFFQNDSQLIDEILVKNSSLGLIRQRDLHSKYQKVLLDPNDRVDDTFSIPKYFRSSVFFWFDIYTHFSSSHMVIHDRSNLAIVYGALDFSFLKKRMNNDHLRRKTQVRYATKKVKAFKTALFTMANGGVHVLSPQIISALKYASVDIPDTPRGRSIFFKKLASRVRSQTGQSDKILSGIRRYLPYKKTIQHYFSLFDIPIHLVAIPFLESSFNPNAGSKANAMGAWQFMRFTGKHFLTINSLHDGRRSVLQSTVAALQLLKQNKQILGRWDLAVAAYNSGTKHLLKAKRKSNSSNTSLDQILVSYKHPHLGFASKNFYSEFLALVHLLSYVEYIYPSLSHRATTFYYTYLTKCKMTLKSHLPLLGENSINVYKHNSHLRSKRIHRSYPRGSIFHSDTRLASSRYLLLPDRALTRIYPRNWYKLTRKSRCN